MQALPEIRLMQRVAMAAPGHPAGRRAELAVPAEEAETPLPQGTWLSPREVSAAPGVPARRVPPAVAAAPAAPAATPVMADCSSATAASEATGALAAPAVSETPAVRVARVVAVATP